MNKFTLTLVFLMGYVSIYAQDYDFKVDGIAYKYFGKTATVVKGSDDMDTIRIPEDVTYDGRTYNITKIGDNAFSNRESLRYISLPKSIQEIGHGAFYCNKYYTSKLSSIILPDSLVSIGNSAFRNCILLNTIAIPNKVKTLGEGAFYGCTTLKSISLSKELTDIGIDAFYNCVKLTHINLPNGIINVGDNIFYGCKSLQTLIIPSTVQTFCTLEGCVGLYQIINLSSINIEVPHSECRIYDKENLLYIKPSQIVYNGCLPTINYDNNLKGFDASVSFLNITKDVGIHNGTAHVDYSNNESSFGIDIPFQYTITPAPLTITINNAQREYGESNPEFTYNINGLVSGESENELDTKPIISCSATTNSSVGNYPIKASASARNYSITVKDGILSITKAPVIVKIENATKKYGEQNPIISVSYIGLKNNETTPDFVKTMSFSTSAKISSPVGKYDIVASGGNSNNYDFTQYLKGVLTVEKAPLTITAKSAAKYYFDENPEFSVSYSGFKNGDDASVLTALPQVSTDAKQNSDAGEYKLSVSGCVCQNYEPKFVNGVFTILPRDLTIKANDAERVYGEENPNFTYEYDGFINDENENVLMTKPILSTNATKTSDVGTYTINVSGAKAVNYKPIYKNGTLTINKASQQIVWEQDLEDLKLHDQVGLNAEASSGLEISYTFDDPSLVSLYNADDMLYMDCVKVGTTTICATQTGNKNYKSAVRVYKTMKIVDTNNPIQPGDAIYMTIKQEGGNIIQEIEKGISYKYQIKALDGWQVNTITFNGIDVTSQLTDNWFTTPVITDDAEISVVFKSMSDGVSSNKTDSDIKVYASDNDITIIGADMNTKVSVFDTNGRQIKAATGNATISIDNGGIYVVKVGNETFKVCL